MLKALFALIAAGFATTMAPLLSAQKVTTINVTTTVYDNNGATALLMGSDDYNCNNCGFANYTTQKNAVTSEIDSNGNWALYIGTQTVRTLFITPDDPVGLQPPAPPQNHYNDVQVHGLCSIPFPSLGMGMTYTCQLGVEFHYNGQVYKLAMGPNLPFGGPATGVASVVCNNVSGNQCVDWTISPNASAPNANVANLYFYSSSKGTATWNFVGQYYNTFLIRVTHP
jgi:hypothetical protein